MSDTASTVVLANDSLPLIKFVGAFVFVIAAMLALAWIARRSGLAGPVLKVGQKRRLKVLETLSVDHRRKLVLIRRDDREHLLLLGPDHATLIEGGMAAKIDTISTPALSPQPAEEADRREHI